MSHSQQLIDNIYKKTPSFTRYGNKEYSNLWYVDNLNKICITFSPRGGCSIAFQQYLDLLGLLNDGLNYDSEKHFIHKYRCDIFHPNISYKNIDNLIEEKYTFVKFIMNPYIRAVTMYRNQTSMDVSFREYLKLHINNQIKYNENDLYHSHEQYIDGEENVITKYVKINENETYNIRLHDNSLYELNANKYTSIHHGRKTNNNSFCGDIPKKEINKNLPKNYQCFYDNEIKTLVDIIYKNDIQKYNFSFNF